MAYLEIRVDPNYEAETMLTALEGVQYKFRFFYNSREQAWQMDVLTDEDAPVISGIKIVPDWELIGDYQSEFLPPGLLAAIDTSQRGEIPGRDDFGADKRVRLIYYESSA